MRARFYNLVSDDLCVTEIDIMDTVESKEFGKSVILVPSNDPATYYYCNSEALLSIYEDKTLELLTTGFVDLAEYGFVWTDEIFDEDDEVSLAEDYKEV